MFQTKDLTEHPSGMITVNNALKYLFLIFPNYCLGRGIMDLAANQFANDLRVMYGKFANDLRVMYGKFANDLRVMYGKFEKNVL